MIVDSMTFGWESPESYGYSYSYGNGGVVDEGEDWESYSYSYSYGGGGGMDHDDGYAYGDCDEQAFYTSRRVLALVK